MYLEQFKRDSSSILKYVPYVFCFLGFMAFDKIIAALMSIDSGLLIQDYINRHGKNITLLIILIQFLFLLILLFLWWKFIHRYSITKLTTAREKIDWQ